MARKRTGRPRGRPRAWPVEDAELHQRMALLIAREGIDVAAAARRVVTQQTHGYGSIYACRRRLRESFDPQLVVIARCKLSKSRSTRPASFDDLLRNALQGLDDSPLAKILREAERQLDLMNLAEAAGRRSRRR